MWPTKAPGCTSSYSTSSWSSWLWSKWTSLAVRWMVKLAKKLPVNVKHRRSRLWFSCMLFLLLIFSQWNTVFYECVYALAKKGHYRIHETLFRKFCFSRSIIVAFVLEAFILEYSLSKTNIESQVEKIIAELGFSANVWVAVKVKFKHLNQAPSVCNSSFALFGFSLIKAICW